MFWSFLGGFLGCLVSNEHHVTHKGSLLSVANSEKSFRRPKCPEALWTCTSNNAHRQVFAGESQRVTKLLLAHLSGDVVAELLLDLLLGLGIEVGHLKHPADFDHFVILSGDARGPFERLFARLHLDDPVAADHFFRFGKRTVGNSRFSVFEGEARANRRWRG